MKKFITWDKLVKDIDLLAKKLKDHKWDAILAISRGGLIPGTILSHTLNIPILKTISAESYVNGKQQELKIEDIKIDETKKWLLVDDLIDSGNTVVQIVKKFPFIKSVAVLYQKPSLVVADYFVSEMPNEWIVFPYERLEE